MLLVALLMPKSKGLHKSCVRAINDRGSSFRDNEAGDNGGALYLRACRFIQGQMFSPIRWKYVDGQQVLDIDTSYIEKLVVDISDR